MRNVRFSLLKVLMTCSGVAMMLSVWGSSALAGDPFRTRNPRNIGEETEAAFEALFKAGDYQAAKSYLRAAEDTERDEPLVHAMQASLSYLEEDWETLKIYADKTLQTAAQLSAQDPLRGNLYLAVGHFLEGSYNFITKDDIIGAISKLQRVLQHLDKAEDSAANDPELNLIKGYLDLILAVNLPFSSPGDAIERLQEYAAPDYLVDRGIAVAYRDLEQYDRALKFAEQALQSSPDNPELLYLKGHLLRHQSKLAQREAESVALLEEAFGYFEQALAKADQLPKSVLKPIEKEHRKTQETLAEVNGRIDDDSLELNRE
ncbi:MAG: Sll0314/Alr1548 family TPR repeat-containing protein [Cyanophyceae cyanobacterium]